MPSQSCEDAVCSAGAGSATHLGCALAHAAAGSTSRTCPIAAARPRGDAGRFGGWLAASIICVASPYNAASLSRSLPSTDHALGC